MLLLCASVLPCVACRDPVDKAAKQRIFSPEDPPQAVAAAAEVLRPEDVADVPRVARRVLGMRAGEVTERIGPHTYVASISWEWSAPDAPVHGLRLQETRELQAGTGGVSGNFHAKLSNSNEQGLEVIRVAGNVFARATYGAAGAAKFRQRLRDRGMAERMRDESFGGIGDFDELFRGRLKLTAQGTSTVEGRTAWKYAVTLGPPLESSAPALPSIAVPRNGVDDTTRRRQAFYEVRQPRTLQGEVFVDAKTSVVLKARLDGRLVVTSKEEVAELRLVLDASMANIGVEPAIAAPAEFLPDEDKPQGIAAALERFGFERTDAGIALSRAAPSKKAADEPAVDEAPEDDEPAAPGAPDAPAPKPAPSKPDGGTPKPR
ncbi:MAG: hypothetical protein JNG84_13550 [Archangium sp.]|nr:hypothetical protein [Archangium sp.]